MLFRDDCQVLLVLLQIMNTDYFYLLLLCFASGFTQCLLLGCFVYLLRHHCRYQFHKSFAVVLLMLSVGFFNNFLVSVCRNLPAAEFINTLLILYDYIIVGGFMIFVVTLVFPGRYSRLQLSFIEVPYVLALALFAITKSPWVYLVVQIITFVISTFLLIWLEYSIKKYTIMLRDNVGNLEYFDLRWGAILLALLYAVQFIWILESLSQYNWFSVGEVSNNLIFDTLWCVITMCYILFVLRKIIQQQVFTVPASETVEQEIENTSPDEYYKVLNNNDVDAVIKEKKYYLDSSLTLQKLAIHLGTNRQYLSNFINRERQKSFYEYINDFRLEEAKKMLDGWTEEKHHSMEDVATMSGFNSYSTFLRSFVKKYGESPSSYLKRNR